MAKKLLAILLAITMVFSLGITAFAEDQEATESKEIELVAEPEQEEGMVYFSAKSDWVSAGKTASIPVSIISKVTPETTPDWYFVTFKAVIENGSEFATVEGFKFNESVKGFDTYKYVINEEIEGTWTVSFAVKAENTVDFLNQKRLEIGTIEVAVDESFPGGDQAIDIVLYNESISMLNLDNEAFWIDFPDGSAWTGGLEYNDTDGIPCGFAEAENMFFAAAHCYQKMPWQDKLIATLKSWASDIINFFMVILNALDGLLQMI